MKCSEGLSNSVSNIIRRYIDRLYYLFNFFKLFIFIIMFMYSYVLFCIFCFHHANWHSSATLTEVFPCSFLSCKANATV